MYAIIDKSTLECICLVVEESHGTAFGDGFFVVDVGDQPVQTPGISQDDLVSIRVPGKIFDYQELQVLAWTGVRRKRDRLLSESDWTVGNDSPLNEMQKRAWRVYRQALRDLPKAQVDPLYIVFPRRPGV